MGTFYRFPFRPMLSWKASKTLLAGFTLIELLVSLTVVAILIGIAAPSYKTWIIEHRINIERDALRRDLIWAKSQAVRLGLNISICKSNNNLTCSPNSLWQQGWLIWQDSNNNNQLDHNEILKVKKPLNAQLTIVSNSKELIFNKEGHLKNFGTTFYFCAKNITTKRLILNRIGRPMMDNGGACS